MVNNIDRRYDLTSDAIDTFVDKFYALRIAVKYTTLIVIPAVLITLVNLKFKLMDYTTQTLLAVCVAMIPVIHLVVNRWNLNTNRYGYVYTKYDNRLYVIDQANNMVRFGQGISELGGNSPLGAQLVALGEAGRVKRITNIKKLKNSQLVAEYLKYVKAVEIVSVSSIAKKGKGYKCEVYARNCRGFKEDRNDNKVYDYEIVINKGYKDLEGLIGLLASKMVRG